MSNNSLINFVDSIFESYQPTMSHSMKIYPSTIPALNISETEDTFQISLALAGVDPKEVKINLTENILNITYEHHDSTTDSAKMLRQEYKHYSFKRSVSLPKSINSNEVKAESKNGILTITIQKLPEQKPKSINIEVK
jgi:HSP20 family protein